MREFVQVIIGMMRKMLWFAIAVIVILFYTVNNLVSFETINQYGWEQYFSDLIQLQLWDTHYECQVLTKVFKEPVLVSEMDKTDAMLYLPKGTIFAANGSQTPKGNNVAWISIKVYRGNEPITGYVFEPSGCLGIFGPYINSDERFVQFLGYEEEEYKNKLMDKFLSEIYSKYTIYTATNNIDEQKLVENDNLKCISHFVENFIPSHYSFINKEKYPPFTEYYIDKNSYISVKNIYGKYFNKNNYIMQLTQI